MLLIVKEKNRKYLIFILIGVILVSTGVLVFLLSYLADQGYIFKKTFGVIDEDILIHVEEEDLPADALYITPDRREYKEGTMRLIVPVIGVDTPVGETTIPEGLQKMAGLYEFSQMPSEQGGNVSIAGHRDIHDKVFYALNEVSGGDYLYIIYDGIVYQYRFKEQKIVAPDDWSVISRQGYTALTLTTCDPIGTFANRLIVVGELVDSFEYEANYSFPATQVTP